MALPAGNGVPAINGSVEKSVDFANYFCTYGFIYHQKEMLSDRVRMDSYYNSIFNNKHHFARKVVLDVGTGSGILTIWSAQAGARKVYVVESTKMAEHAKALANANNVEDIVQVIEGSMEEVNLPEKVDVIISECMGYFLLRESMFDSVICVRDRWLKPSGVMYPSHAQMWVAPVRSGLGDQKMNEYETAMNDWYSFINDIDVNYGVNMNALTKAYREEHEKYYLKTSQWNSLHPSQIIGTPAVIKEFDCLKATIDEIRNVSAKFLLPINFDRTRLSAFAGWFDVHFRGSTQNPVKQEVELTTAPSVDNSTHWGQQVFLIQPPLRVDEGDKLMTSFSMSRSRDNHRLMDVNFTYELQLSSGKCFQPISRMYYKE